MICFCSLYGDHRDLHLLTPSFPTRRSSDLVAAGGPANRLGDDRELPARRRDRRVPQVGAGIELPRGARTGAAGGGGISAATGVRAPLWPGDVTNPPHDGARPVAALLVATAGPLSVDPARGQARGAPAVRGARGRRAAT